jgi:hypothetical protein
MVVTREDFDSWKGSQVTQAFMKALFNDRNVLKEMLTVGTEMDERVRGRIAALTEILRVDYEGFVESLQERKDDE